MAESPEVYLVRAEMARTGVDFCLDVHGDEALPYAFISGAEGIPSYSEAQARLLARFQAMLVVANADFQTEHGLSADPAGQGQPRHLRQLHRRDLRLSRHDPGTALQGCGERARLPLRLVADELPPPGAELRGGAGRGGRHAALSRARP